MQFRGGSFKFETSRRQTQNNFVGGRKIQFENAFFPEKFSFREEKIGSLTVYALNLR